MDLTYLLVVQDNGSPLLDFRLERTQSLAKRKRCGRAVRSIGRLGQPGVILRKTGKPFRELVARVSRKA